MLLPFTKNYEALFVFWSGLRWPKPISGLGIITEYLILNNTKQKYKCTLSRSVIVSPPLSPYSLLRCTISLLVNEWQGRRRPLEYQQRSDEETFLIWEFPQICGFHWQTRPSIQGKEFMCNSRKLALPFVVQSRSIIFTSYWMDCCDPWIWDWVINPNLSHLLPALLIGHKMTRWWWPRRLVAIGQEMLCIEGSRKN